MKTQIRYLLLILIIFAGNTYTALGQSIDSTSIRIINVSFLSNGFAVKGWLFVPSDTMNKKLPAIVMAPGFSGTKECNYQFFAANFSKEGFAVLLFDYPNFGESSGSVQYEVDPWQQIQAYRDGISYLESRDDIDVNRIGVWGGSYSGGHALVVSAIDHRVKCVVSMTPFISGSFYIKNLPDKTKSFLFQQFNADRLSRIKGKEPARIPVATNDSRQFSAISGSHAWDFIESFKHYAPSFKNSVTLKSLEMQLEYEPGLYVQNIGAIPKLFIIAKQDEMVPEQLILDAFNIASEPKKLIYLEGYHFSPYMEKLPEASKQALDWFKNNL